MARELWLSTIASAASGSTDEMLIPSNGAVLTIADMTSGNVNVQSYATGSWVTVETYTADTVINVGVAPGTLTRITWDTVVGTPTISLMYASDNGFAEAAGDIVTIEADVATIETSLYGSVIVDMADADYTMTEAESKCSLIYVINPGNGTKVLTIGAYASTPIRVTVYVLGSAPIGVKYSGETAVAPAFPNQINPLARFPSFGMIRDQSQSVIKSSVGGTTTAGNANEQIIEQLIIPARCFNDGESVHIDFSALKSGIATTETVRIKLGDQGDSTDVQLWTNSLMATTVVAISFNVKIQRVSATVVSVVSILNVLAPNGNTTINTCFAQVTVDNMDSNPVYISISGQNSTGAETVTSKYLRGMLSS